MSGASAVGAQRQAFEIIDNADLKLDASRTTGTLPLQEMKAVVQKYGI